VTAATDSDGLIAYLLDLLAPLGSVSVRRMFGGTGLFHRGLMFGLIARDELYLKVGDSNRTAYQTAGEGPFTYGTKHGANTIQFYWRCPPELLDNPETFRHWAHQAVEAATAAAQGKLKTSRKRGLSR